MRKIFLHNTKLAMFGKSFLLWKYFHYTALQTYINPHISMLFPQHIGQRCFISVRSERINCNNYNFQQLLWAIQQLHPDMFTVFHPANSNNVLTTFWKELGQTPWETHSGEA